MYAVDPLSLHQGLTKRFGLTRSKSLSRERLSEVSLTENVEEIRKCIQSDRLLHMSCANYLNGGPN